jgi:hypothetical protein
MSGTTIGANGALLASWTTAGRPASPVAGQMGWNSTLGALDFYNGSTWYNISDINVDSSGNVGIGTSSPSSKLTVNGASGALNFNLANVGGFGTLATFGVLNIGTDNSSYIGSVSNNPFLFYTNNTERARIDTSGNLLVGTTSVGNANNNGISLSVGDGCVRPNHVNGTPTGYAYMQFGYNASSIGSITQNGTTGVLYNLTSDYRLKNDQQPLTGAKEFVMALQPKKWQWWDGSGEGVGFIAHEFMEVAKYSGHGEKDAVDADGNPIYQTIQPSSSEVMANLVSLIQEQQALITQLQSDLSALVTRISALEAPKSAN